MPGRVNMVGEAEVPILTHLFYREQLSRHAVLHCHGVKVHPFCSKEMAVICIRLHELGQADQHTLVQLCFGQLSFKPILGGPNAHISLAKRITYSFCGIRCARVKFKLIK